MIDKIKKEEIKERKVYSDPYQVAEKLRDHVGVSIVEKHITVTLPSLGIKAWGMVDFLCHYAGYNLTMVNKTDK
jgi:hypothetical protein